MRYNEILIEVELREELRSGFEFRHPTDQTYARLVTPLMKGAYDARMKLTGQNGLSDYDEGFTNFLLAVEAAA